MTDQEYINDNSKWGKDSFVSLKNVIDNIRLKSDEDSYFKNAGIYQMRIHGKEGLKEIGMFLNKRKKSISFQLGPEKKLVFPRFMTNWFRVSVLNKCKKLTPLNINNTPQVTDYLQDNQWNLLFDNDGNILEGKVFNPNKGHCKIEVDPCLTIHYTEENQNKTEDYSNSWVKPLKEDGYFVFSDDLVDKVIILEYEVSGHEDLDDCDILFHEALVPVLENWIKFNLLEGKRNVPEKEVMYFRRRWKIEKEKVRPIFSNKITLAEILDSVSLRYLG